MFLEGIFVVVLSCLCDFRIGAVSDRVFDAQPKIITQDGHLIFLTADNHNITFKSLGQGSIRIDEDDLRSVVGQAKRSIVEMERIKTDDIAVMRQNIRQLEQRLTDLHSTETRLSDLEETVRQFREQFSGDANGSRLAEIARNHTRLSRQVQRLQTEFREVKRLLERNDCDNNPCLNGGTCIDSYNDYSCKCPSNFEGVNCDSDVNECREFFGTSNGCQNGATCVNTLGSYTCQCPPDWYGVHCTERHEDCTAASTRELCDHGTCVNQARIQAGQPKFTCICDQGWTTEGRNPACNIDVDECQTGRHSCSQNPLVQCINIPGSFVCGPCPAGYSGNGFDCSDVDECLTRNGGCSLSPMVQCVNTPGSRQCGSCPAGYHGDGVSCVFFGICNTNNGGCHPLATCIENSAISSTYRECRCPPGFLGPGFGFDGCVPHAGGGTVGPFTPVPFNPCDANPCLRGTCVASGPYVFRCNCPLGYEGQRCELDGDNCVGAPCLNGGTCVDRPNGYSCHCSPHQTGINCEQDVDACGESLHDVNGTIRYPSNPSLVYQNDKSCAWVIVTTAGMVLNLTFPEFHLESSSDCAYDFVQVNDGQSAGSHLIGCFCGSSPPHGGNIVTTHNAVYIWFHSDSSIPGDGFRIQWETVEPVCGSDLPEASHGTVSSPGYPGQYPMDRDCVWTIRVPLGKRIIVSFATLMLEHHDNCDYDFLEIRDGLRDVDHILGKYCGTETRPPSPIETSGSFANIYFHSDHSRTANGFHLTYSSVPSVHGCGGLLTTASGAFSSPDHPNPYTHGLECDWEIRVPSVEKIRLTFTFFDIEAHDRCLFDFIEIYDGSDETAPLLGRYCGRNLPPDHVSVGNTLFVKFNSDYSIARHGFRATYIVVCGGTFTEPHGIINSPYYPEPYPATRECIYGIRQAPGKAIELHFVAFDVEASYNCRYDYLLIRDGDTELAPIQGRYCGMVLPDMIVSTYNALWLQFQTDSSIHNRGFLANYTTIDVACGGILTELSGAINSPNHPDEYLHGVDCRWILRPPPGHVVQLTFTSFALERHDRCDFDYVAVYDNTTTENADKLVRRYCGNDLPPTITSTDNLMLVVFHSDSSVAYDGFAIRFLAFDASSFCGGDFYSTTGVIRSPNYPNGYPHSRQCTWKIEVPAGQQIMLNFTGFELESHTDCNYDYLEIRNGGSPSSPLIGKYCGTRVPPIVPSHGNRLLLQFNSDSSYSAPGFEVTWDGTTTGCGGQLTSSAGSIISPNYPEACNVDLDCTWRITVGRGNKVKIHFVDLSLPSTEDCAHEGVEFYNGKSIRSPLMRRVCGSTFPDPFVSAMNEVFVRYRCNEWSTRGHRGFHLLYETACRVHVSGRRGVIETPNFPNPYPHDRNCSWNIRGPTGNKLNMSFSILQLEETPNCRFDFITVYDNSNRSTLGPYCSSAQMPSRLSMTSNEAIVNFVSDASFASNGFSLEWIASGCGSDLRKPFGSFSTPNYPSKYPNQITCDWEISAEPGNNIELTIHDYDIESSRNCIFDVLKIYGGTGTGAPLLTALCHRQTSPVHVASSGNHMYLQFKSDVNRAFKGFNASYIVKTDACGGIFTVNAGAFHSRNYPEHYTSKDDCSWLITVDKGHSVQLSFMDFEVPALDGDCSVAYVSVYDGPDESSPLLLSHCGSDLPSPTTWNSSDNQMFVKMRADESISAKGFAARYSTRCGAILYADEPGIIKSRGPQSIGTSSSKCTWVIRARNLEDKVALLFTSLEVLRPPTNCTRQPLIEVFDGEQSDSPLLIRICTAHVPPVITSRASTIRVVTVNHLADLFTASYYEASAGCGGTFDSVSGTFVSPDYPSTYPVTSECVWTIKTSPGHRAMLSFSVFDVEESEFCNLDYVEIRENDEGGRLIGRYCGNELPSNLTAAHQLWVKFSSDAQNGRQGFVASYHLLYGSNPSGSSGEIASPLYPKTFRGRETFEWTITVPLEMHVQITVLEMSLMKYEYRETCMAQLTFRDGSDETSELLATHCGTDLPSPVVSSGNQMFVQFSSSIFYGSGNTFFLIWNATVDWPVSPTGITPTVQNRTSDCDAVITLDHHESRTLVSPGFPNGYEINKHCVWQIVTPIGTKPTFYFNALDLEGYYQCYSDYVELFGGTTVIGEWENLGRFCSRDHEQNVLVSGTNVMKVIFSSDYSYNGTGFSAQVIPACGGNITAPSGSIQTPNFPNNYDDYVDCNWMISVRPGRTIRLRFQDFQLEGDSPICRNDYVVLRNGLSRESPLLGSGKYCGSSLPTVPETTSNHLFVRFVSNPSFSYKGFRFFYDEISLECGGLTMFAEGGRTSQLIETPNFPSPYPVQTQCEWTFVAPPMSRVRFDFEDHFDVPFEQDCFDDYLVVYDGGTAHAPVLGRFCGHDRPSTVQSSGSTLFARFSSVDPHPSSGFRATAKIASCGGTISAGTGTITSPHYPHGYVDGLDCEWIVRGLPGHFLVFRMADIQTTVAGDSAWNNCSGADSVIVRDFNRTGTVLGEFCGEELSAPVSTAGSVAYVRFTSKRNSPLMRGFRLIFNNSLEECGGELTTSSGVITSPNHPGLYPNHRTCNWEIRAPLDRRIRLTFTYLDMQGTRNGRCFDYVIAFNLATVESDYVLLPPFYVCGRGGEMPVITSGSNYMRVNFVSDGDVSGTGFRAVYDTDLESECGGDLSLPSGTVVSPGLGVSDNYTHNLLCRWDLVGDRPNSTFVVRLNEMTIEGSLALNRPNCLYDRLDIYSGPEFGSGFPFASLCGNLSEPITIAVPFSSVVFHFKTDTSIAYGGFNLSYSANDCGGELNNAGIIVSPRYPSSYGGNVHCAWVMRFEEGQQVQITFDDFELESSAGCTADRLVVRNGMSTFSPLIGTYCGEHPHPPYIRSQRHEVYVEFTSNADTSGRGFRLSVAPAVAGCGGVFHGSTGLITSIGYPNKYPANVECEWILEGKPGFYYTFSFAGRFDLEMSASCANDYVEGYEFEDHRWHSLGRRCGRDVQPPFVTKSPKFGLTFHTNEAIDGNGFQATWNESCGGTLTDKSGTFMSPGYPEPYPNSVTCVYVISPDPAHYVVITFDDFGLEESPDCIFDMMEIYEGNSTSGKLLKRACGTTLPEMVSSLGSITVRLATDSSIQHKGFRARYRVSECGAVLNHSADATAVGVIASPTHPDRYHANMNCTWIIEASANRVIYFKFQEMSVEQSYTDCQFDHVSLFDGASTLSPLLGRFCGAFVPNPMVSTGNLLTIQFSTDDVVEEGGFRGVYRTTYGSLQGCGGVLNTTFGTVQSLDYDNDGQYESGLECMWTIMGAPFKVVQLTFHSFDVEKPAHREGCPWDSLQVRDGPSPESNLIDTLCGTEKPNTIVSSTNQMWLKFSSDDTINKAGFRASYASVEPECGGFINVTNATNGFVHSPNYPEHYPSNARCRWSFVSSSADEPTIELRFIDFQLEDSYRCTKDFLTFQEANFNGVSNAMTLCGHTKPADVYLDGSFGFHVLFASNSLVTDYGFKIGYRLAPCDRSYEEPYGSISRFRDWSMRPDALDCRIRITVAANRTITLSFYTFVLDFANFGNCDEFMEIRDGSTETAPLLAKLCGHHDVPNPVSSTGNEMWIRLFVLSATNYYRIMAQYYSTDQDPGCGGEMVSTTGALASPRFPSNYSRNAVCRWKVTVPHDHAVSMHFAAFDIRSSENCTDASLQIYDGEIESDDHLVDTFCGTDYPGPVNIVSNKFLVKYVTSTRNIGTGFRIVFSSHESSQPNIEEVTIPKS